MVQKRASNEAMDHGLRCWNEPSDFGRRWLFYRSMGFYLILRLGKSTTWPSLSDLWFATVSCFHFPHLWDVDLYLRLAGLLMNTGGYQRHVGTHRRCVALSMKHIDGILGQWDSREHDQYASFPFVLLSLTFGTHFSDCK